MKKPDSNRHGNFPRRRDNRLRRLVIEALEDRRLLTVSLPELVSVNELGTGSGNSYPGWLSDQSLSGDGRYEVFESTASDLVANDTNGVTDVFLRDLLTGETTLISHRADGYSANYYSQQPAISADGQYVAYVSYATDLDVTGTQPSSYGYQIYRWDRLTDTTVLVSVNQDDTDGGNGTCYDPSISGDGQRIAYRTEADDLVSGITDANVWYSDVYLRDFTGDKPTTILVSRSADDPTFTGNYQSADPRMSRDGSRVLYLSGATDLESGVSDVNGYADDLIVFDVITQSNHYVSVTTTDDTTGNAGASRTRQSLSADGRYEVFESDASDLVPTDMNGYQDVFLRDLETGEITLISHRADGYSANYHSQQPAISADGQYVAFVSYATDLDVTGTQPSFYGYQIYRWDRLTDTTVLVSVNQDDTDGGNGTCYDPSISGDGQRIAYRTEADDLVSGITDANVWYSDVYLRDFTGDTPTTILVSRSADDPTFTGNYQSADPRMSRDGSRVLYLSGATDLESGVSDVNGYADDLIVFDVITQSNHYVSVTTTDDTTSNAGASRTRQSLSADGRYEVFESNANDLVVNDTNGTTDVFLRDLLTGETTLISHRADGNSANSSSQHAVISADGQYVAFVSYATDLDVTGTQPSFYGYQIYRWDRLTDTTVLVSVNQDDTDGGNGTCYDPSISGDGQRIAYRTEADDLVSGITDANVWYSDVYLRDFTGDTPTTILVSRSADDPTFTGNYQSADPRMSRDGSRVLYLSGATDLESGVSDVNGYADDLIVFDVITQSNHYVSVTTTDDTTSNAGASRTRQSLSADGRYEVFESNANDLVVNDTNGTTDVFLRDLLTGETTLISHRADGNSANSSSQHAVISADGQYVAFVSYATDLDATGTNSSSGYSQVYRWDRLADTVVLVSPNASDSDGGNSHSYDPSISGDGQRIAYRTEADNLVSGITDANGWYSDVYLRDFTGDTPITILVSRSADDETLTGDGYSADARISRNGAKIAFGSTASDLANGIADGNGNSEDLFVFDISSLTNIAVNLATGGTTTGNAGMEGYAISDDGQTITFASYASDLHSDDSDSYWDVFVRDLSGMSLELISVDTSGLKRTADSYTPSISGDGRYVAFESQADLDSALDTDGWQDIYVRDRGDGIVSPTTTLISVNSDGTASGNDYSYEPQISHDGSTVAFYGYATDLDASVSDTNDTWDVFLRDWQAATPETTLVSRNSDGTDSGNGLSWQPELSDDGGRLVFTSQATDLMAGIVDVNGTEYDIFAFDGSDVSLVTQKGPGEFTGRSGADNAFDVSDSGQFVVFSTWSAGMVADETNGHWHVYVRDVVAETTERVSVDSTGLPGNSNSYTPSISGDGRYVAFESQADLDSALDTDGWQDIYVRDRGDGIVSPTTTLISVNSDGTASGNDYSYEPQISYDGSTVAFYGYATDLDASVSDTNDTWDVFIRDWQAATPETTLVSRNSDGTDSGNGLSWQPELSDDGGRLVFTSQATDLMAGIVDVNGTEYDIFAFDGSDVSLVTEKGPGRFTGLSGVDDAAFDLSDSGQFVVFSTWSAGMVADETNGHWHVCVRDVVAETTERVSVDSTGLPGNSNSYTPSISGDGRYVAFESQADLDSALDTDGWQDIYVRDRGDGIVSPTTTLISVNSDGTASGNDYSYEPQISHDGSTVAFYGYATDLDASVSDTNDTWDVFIRDWQAATPETTLVSRNSDGTDSGNGLSWQPELSDDGGRLVFTSQATDLMAGIVDVNGTEYDIFAFDGSDVSLVTQKGPGEFTGRSGADNAFDVSDSGQFVVFSTWSAGMVADETNGHWHVYVRDVVAETTERVSVDSTGLPGNSNSYTPSISGDGRYVAFESQADLDSALDTDGWQDIYVRDRGDGIVSPTTTLISVNSDGTASGNDYSYEPQISYDGSTVAFYGYATDLDASVNDVNGTWDVFLRKWRTASPVTDLVSRDSVGSSSGNDSSAYAEVSEDGATLTFLSYATDLTELSDTNDLNDIFVVRAAEVSIAPLDAAKLEGDSATSEFTFTVSRDWYINSEITVHWVLSGSGANPADADDFGGVFPSGQVTFSAGATEQIITIDVNGELEVEEDEGFTITLTDSNENSQIIGKTADGTILNNDIDLEIVPHDAEMNEKDSGIAAFTFTVDRIGYTGIATTVDWAVTGSGTNSVGIDDFDGSALPNGTTTFEIGETVKTITVNVAGESLVEMDEGFTVTLSNPSPNAEINTATATGTILNDDAALISIDAPSVLEGGILEFGVSIDNPVDVAVTADRETSDGTATLADSDYTGLASSNVSLFAAGSTTPLTIQVQTTADDTVELDETLNVILSNLFSDGRDVSFAGLESTLSGTGTIENDDAALISIDAPSVLEGGILEFGVSIDNPVDVAVTADRETSDGTATLADSDYTGLASSNVSLFAAGSTTPLTIQVQTTADDTVELDETLSVILSNLFSDGRDVSFAGLESTLSGTGTIENDDAALISIDAPSVLEGGILEFGVSIDNPVDVAVTADRETSDGTATLADSDYTGLAFSNVSLFAAGSTTPLTIQVQTTADDTVELDETLNVILSNLFSDGRDVSFAGLESTLSGTGTIENDDTASIRLGDVGAYEADGVLNFAVTCDFAIDVDVTVQFRTIVGGSATPGVDYSTVTGQLVTLPARSTAPQIVTVTVTDEKIVEPDETILAEIIDVSAGERAVLIDDGNATGTIVNDDEAMMADIIGRVESSGDWWLARSDGTSFSNEKWGSWSSSISWEHVLYGDFNGDGQEDIAGRDAATGRWYVSTSGNEGLSTKSWGIWSTNVTWQDVAVGDFNGDGLDDIIGRVSTSGDWWVAQSTGNSFANAKWGRWSTAVSWLDVKVADFDGDGDSDIAGRVSTSGDWWVAQSTGTAFANAKWTRWSTSVDWINVATGDFNGDGSMDLVGQVTHNGSWYVATSTGSAFTNAKWTQWSTSVDWVDVNIGDFNGDGLSDLIGRVETSGKWYVATSTGTSFTNARWGRWSSAVGWLDVQVGDFDGDGRSDLAGRVSSSGDWWVARSQGDSFTNEKWGRWSTAVGWEDVHAGNFGGAGDSNGGDAAAAAADIYWREIGRADDDDENDSSDPLVADIVDQLLPE
jgi:hypothetical protein